MSVNNLPYLVLEQFLKAEKFSLKYSKCLNEDILADQSRFENTEKELEKAIREKLVQLESTTSWENYAKLAASLAHITSIFTGTSCLATGALSPMGIGLIASGGFGLVNQALEYTGGWEKLASYFRSTEHEQKALASKFQLTAMCTATLLGLAGALYSVTGSLAKAATTSTLTSYFASIAHFTNAGVAAGTGVSEKNLKQIEADNIGKQAQYLQEKNFISDSTTALFSLAQSNERTVEMYSTLQQAYLRSCMLAQQPA